MPTYKDEKTGLWYWDSSKACLLREFCRSYTGDFLPELRQAVWAEESRAYYHRQYFSCLRRLCRILEEQKEYDELLKLCTSAARIYPYDQWQLVQLRCLTAMKRYEEAFTLYERTISCFERNFGIHVEEKAAADCWSNLKLTSNGAGALIRIQDELREKTREEGAYFCSVLSFGDLYRIVTRMKERRKIEPFLLVCTLGGNETQEAEEEWIEKLRCFCRKIFGVGMFTPDTANASSLYCWRRPKKHRKLKNGCWTNGRL